MAEPDHSNVRIRDIYLRAKEIGPGADRERYLDTACGANTELRREVESLLEADRAADGFLSNSALGDQLESALERPGAIIGHYRLLEVIGEGGFGTVYRAEQLEPVQREVALKILKLGMDTREVIARFEAERQALALMDHPNIAHVYDAGSIGDPASRIELPKSEIGNRKLPLAGPIS